MKKLMMVLLAGAVLFGGGGLACAEETTVSLGLKVWGNSWEFEDMANGTKIEYDPAVMVGPSLTVKNANLFFGATFLATTQDYSNTETPGFEFNTSRTDLDLIAGYMFTPRFGVYAGYKSLEATLKATAPLLSLNDQDAFDITIKGPGVGILGNYPFNDVVAVYGNLGFLSVKATSKPTPEWSAIDPTAVETSETLSGVSIEIGAAFVINESWSANVGIKSQSFTGDDSKNTFSGGTGGVTYTF